MSNAQGLPMLDVFVEETPLILVAEYQRAVKAGTVAEFKVTRILRAVAPIKVKVGETLTVYSDYTRSPYFKVPEKTGQLEMLFLQANPKVKGAYETRLGANGRWPCDNANLKMIQITIDSLK